MVAATVELVKASSVSYHEDMATDDTGETVESTQRSLSQLRLLIENEVSLDCPTDDKFLLKFLRAAKYRVKEAFERIQRYFNARQRWPELFDDLSPSTVNYGTVVTQNRLVMVSKQRDPEGRTVALIKMGSWNSGICPLTDFMRACIVLAEWSLLNEEAQLRGIVGVIDLKGLQLSHMAHYTPFVVKMAAHIGQCRHRVMTDHTSGHAMMNVNVTSKLAVSVSSPPDVEHVARTELGETQEIKERCLLRLRQLIAGDTRLYCPADDKFLVKFLRGRKYQVEETFKTIQKYFRVRQTSVDLFKDLFPTAVPFHTILVDNRLMMLSKGKDYLGRPVALIKMGSWHSGICSLVDLYRAALIMAEWALLDEETQIRGVVGVCDLKGLRAHHVAHFTPFSLKNLAHIVQIHFMGHDLQKLHGILPPDVIPAEWGGTHEEFDCYSQEMDVLEAQEYFEQIARYGFRD